MSSPRLKPFNFGEVSILLPCLNAREFLEARIDSILNQTYTNWKAIVLDSYSDDGSWEYFESIAEKDSRFELYQIPRDGLYAALNLGIDLSKGEFLHIATCDDTMDREFLSATVQALLDFPMAGIAVTDLRFIDRVGGDDCSGKFGAGHVKTSRCGETFSEINVRPPPHDCLLHMSLQTVYVSLTQLLIRTEVIQPVNRFEVDVGPSADLGWSMNLCKNVATVHIPRKLATWRHHGSQLSLDADPKRMNTVSNACVLLMDSIEGLSPGFKKAFLLPANRELVRGRMLKAAPIYAGCLFFIFKCMITKPTLGIKAMKSAKFGCYPLRTSWISFLLTYLEISPSSHSEMPESP